MRAATFVLAALLLYLALRGIDFGEVWEALRTADYRWLFPLVAVLLFSHLLRAWRWKVLLDAVPPDPESDNHGAAPITLGTAFASLMIGYMANYVAPRFGEVARAAHLAGHSRLRFSTILGTVVAERVIDVASLLVALISVVFILAGRSEQVNDLFLAPAMETVGGLSGGVIALVSLAILGVIGAVAAVALLSTWGRETLAPILGSFRDGLMTLTRTRRTGVMVGTTVGMWAGYLIAAYLPLVMLGLTEPYGLTLIDGWAIMVLGTLGIVVPSPGGIGSFHYVTIQSLVYLFGVGADPAATYAVLVHAAQMILYAIVGALVLAFYGTGLKTTAPAEQTPGR
jgi:glycosyltransferase 2 family protein